MRRLILLAVALWVAAAGVSGSALADDNTFRLRKSTAPSRASVAGLNLTNSAIVQYLEEQGYQAYTLQANVTTWLQTYNQDGLDIFLAVPQARPTLGWTLRRSGQVLCMQAPSGGAGTVMDYVGFLIAATNTPDWTTNTNQVCSQSSSN